MPITIERRSVVWEAADDDPVGHACEPRIERLADGGIVLAFRTGTRRESADGRPRLLRSEDDGTTWDDLGRPFDAMGATGWDLRGAALAELRDGSLLTVIVALDKSSTARPTTRRPKAWCPSPTRSRSRAIAARHGSGSQTSVAAPCRRPRRRGCSSCPMATSCARSRPSSSTTSPARGATSGARSARTTAAGPGASCVISAASDPDGDPHDTMWWDPRIARLASGELVEFCYAFRHRTRTEGPVHALWSNDDGRTWTAARAHGAPRPGDLPDPALGRSAASSSSSGAPASRPSSPTSATTADGPSTRIRRPCSTTTQRSPRPAPTAP